MQDLSTLSNLISLIICYLCYKKTYTIKTYDNESITHEKTSFILHHSLVHNCLLPLPNRLEEFHVPTGHDLDAAPPNMV